MMTADPSLDTAPDASTRASNAAVRASIMAYLDSLPPGGQMTVAHMDVVEAIIRAGEPGSPVATEKNSRVFAALMEVSGEKPAAGAEQPAPRPLDEPQAIPMRPGFPDARLAQPQGGGSVSPAPLLAVLAFAALAGVTWMGIMAAFGL